MKRSLTVFWICVLAMAAGIGTAYAEEQVKITIATHLPPVYDDLFPPMQRFSDRISELGQGKVQVQFHHSETMFKATDLVPALMRQAVDIIFHISAHVNEKWPELGGIGLPFLYTDENDCRDRLMPGKPLFDLLNQEMNKQYGVRIMASGILRGLVIATTRKSIEKYIDFSGLKMRSLGKIDAGYINACGGETLFIPTSHLNEALKKGTLDGIVSYPGTIISRKLTEELNFITDTKPMFSAWGYQIYMLSKTFDKLPKDIQKVIIQAAAEYDTGYLEKSLEYDRQKVKPILEKKVTFISPNADQMKLFIESAQKVYAEWSKTVDPEFAKKFIEMSQQ